VGNLNPVALYHTGYTSVYFPDANTGDLDEAFLPAISGPWKWQDMTSLYKVPSTRLIPSPLVHDGIDGALTWTSVFTEDFANGDIRETYLDKIGDPNSTTQNYPAIPPGS
jgi:hypothetical protein